MAALPFYAAEITAYQPATAVQAFALGRGSKPRGALTVQASQLDSTATLLASDTGYRTRPDDAPGTPPGFAGGVQVYPAVLDTTFEVDRHVGLEPGSANTATFGAIRLNNLGRRFDSFVQARNSDGRPVRVLSGAKAFDAGRGLFVDPPRASLQPLFGGSALPWQLSEETLEIPLRDAAYTADRPLQATLYAGTGGYAGGADLAGKEVPITRGGTAANPVLNVPLVCVDSANLIYQWTDAYGQLLTLYEGGAAVFTFAGDVADLYSGMAPMAGTYRTNNARGLVQMGSKPVNTLTADVTGFFAGAGAVSTAAQIARYLLSETMGQPDSVLDLPSFAAADAAYPYVAGFYAGSNIGGLAQVQALLGSIGARLVATRTGLLSVFLLRQLPASASPAAAFTTANALSVTPQPLPSTLDPPPSQWRVGWGLNNTVQSSGLNSTVSAARQRQLALDYRVAPWFGSAVATAWRNANRPAPVNTMLLAQAQAQALANDLGALWARENPQGLSLGRPGLYDVEVPIEAALPLNLGSVVLLRWPLGNLADGRLGQIVGEQLRSVEASATLSVLVS